MSPIVQDLARFGPEQCGHVSLEEALAYTRRLAESHPENFHVISRLLPPALRGDFANAYAFCRWADDLADEVGDPQRSLMLLAWWAEELACCYAGMARHPVFIALGPTIRRHHLPIQPFADLIAAFRQDQQINRYQTWTQLLDYCRLSANPVGRLVLLMCGYREEQHLTLADHTCTALQLANHWQDVRRDLFDRNRIYIPREVAASHGLDLDSLAPIAHGNTSTDLDLTISDVVRVQARSVLKDLVDRTWPFFSQGRDLWSLVGPEVRPILRLFTLGGEAVLRCIVRGNYDTLVRRPQLGRATKLWILSRVWLRAQWERA